MADQTTLPVHSKPDGPPAEAPAAASPADDPPAEESGGPSKSALKKAAKDKAKAEKAAARIAKEQAQQTSASADDVAAHRYGALPADADLPAITNLLDIERAGAGNEVTVVARADTSRQPSAKLGFLMLRQQGKKAQAVVAASDEISRQMVKWTCGININSIVQVTGVLKTPEVPIATATLSHTELHIRKIYMVSEAVPMLPMQIKDAEKPPPEGDEEGLLDAEGTPLVTLKTRLDNRVLDLQTETNQAITWISSGVTQLFAEYMLKSGSRWIFSSKLMGSSTEGGSDVFEVKYFKRKAYLSQSPQLGKQMCIAGDMKSVFEIGPVFRAENSNTHRHLTEVGLFLSPF